MAAPFALLLIGLPSGAVLGLLLLQGGVAAITIVTTLRRLWRLQHPSRWQYAFVATALLTIVGLFTLNDNGPALEPIMTKRDTRRFLEGIPREIRL